MKEIRARLIPMASALACAVLLTASPVPAPASAGQFVIHPCDDASQNVAWELVQFAWFNRSVECPLIRAWAGPMTGPVTFPVAARYPAIFARDTTVYIVAATMNMEGLGRPDLGRRQGVRFCSKTECGPILPGAGASEGAQSFSREAGEIPAGAQWIEVVGDCEAGIDCPETPELRVSGIALTYADLVIPTLDWHEPNIISTDLGTDRWIRSSRPITYTSSDNGSGIAHTRFEYSPSGHVQFGPSACSTLTQPFEMRFCLNSARGPAWTPDPVTQPELLPEGDNTVRFQTFDMGGRSSAVREIRFHVDITSPRAPRNLRVVGSPSGWTNQTVADIAWDPVDDTPGAVKMTIVEIGTAAAGTLGGNPGMLTGVSLTPHAVTNLKVYAIDKAGNTGASSTISVGHDDYVLAPPALNAPRYVGLAALRDDGAVTWDPPDDLAQAPSGICGYSLDVNDDPLGEPPAVANVPGIVARAAAPGDRFEGDHFMHVRAISCSGQAGAAAHAEVNYDLTPPRAEHERPQSVWLNEGDPLTIRGFDAQTAVRAVHYAIDDGPEVSVPGDQTSITLTDGLHEVRYQAEDRAGNRSAQRSILMGVDGTPPQAWIEPADPDRPTLIRAFAADERAGLEWARFVFRPAGSQDGWRPFGDPQRPNPATPQAVSLSARFPDTELPDGQYELGVRVRDRVGREIVTTASLTGRTPTLRLPLRAAPALSVVVTDGSRRAASAFVRFGEGATVTGRLLDANGAPLGRARVELSERRALTTGRSHLRAAITDQAGGFRARLGPGVAREIYARFDGTELLRPRERMVRLLTRSRVGLKVWPRRVRAGQPLHFDMRVALRGASISNVGRLADVQFLERSGRWKNYTIDGPYALQLDSRRSGWARFVKRDKAPELSVPRVLRFRLYVPAQERWPYVAGWSRTVPVTVLPVRRR